MAELPIKVWGRPYLVGSVELGRGLLMNRFIGSLVMVIVTAAVSCGQEAELNAYLNYIQKGLTDGRKAVPKVIPWVKHENKGVALKSIAVIELVGTKLKDSDEAADKTLRKSIAKALIQSELTEKRAEVAKAAKLAAPKVAPEEELKGIRAEVEKSLEKKKD